MRNANFLFSLNRFALSSSVIVLWPVERRFDGITCLLVDHLIVLLIRSLCYYLLRSLLCVTGLLIPTIRILTRRWSITSARLEPHLLLLYLIHLTCVIFGIVGFHVDAVISLTAVCALLSWHRVVSSMGLDDVATSILILRNRPMRISLPLFIYFLCHFISGEGLTHSIFKLVLTLIRVNCYLTTLW